MIGERVVVIFNFAESKPINLSENVAIIRNLVEKTHKPHNVNCPSGINGLLLKYDGPVFDDQCQKYQ